MFSFPFSPFAIGSRGCGSGVCVLPRRTLAFAFAFTFALVAPPSSTCVRLKLDLAELLAISRGVIAIWVQSTFCCLSVYTVLGMLLACLELGNLKMWVSGEASVVEEEDHVAPFQSSLDLLSEAHGLGRSIDFLGDRG